jgi:hypothetical protein
VPLSRLIALGNSLLTSARSATATIPKADAIAPGDEVAAPEQQRSENEDPEVQRNTVELRECGRRVQPPCRGRERPDGERGETGTSGGVVVLAPTLALA